MVRDDSHVLRLPGDGKVTMVEFLDFACEACGALYPFYEELRNEYAGKVRFVARYFTIPSQFNAMNAASRWRPRPSRATSSRCTR